MNKVGKKVLIRRGIFIGYEGVVAGVFKYNEKDVYVVNMYRGKNITEKFTITLDNNDFEYIN